MQNAVSYQSSSGEIVNLTPKQIERLKSADVWPRDQRGEEMCQVAHGLHLVGDLAIMPDEEIDELISNS